MITGMNHTGFVVRDLDKAVQFYTDVVGLRVTATRERTGAPIEQVLGYEGCHIKLALLGTEKNGHLLELIQYMQPPAADRPPEERSVLGGSHLAFNVDDIHETFQGLISRGAQKLNPPIEITPGRVACYLQDPDGNWLELMEVHE